VLNRVRTCRRSHIGAHLTFAPIIKAKIVEYPWELWNRSSAEPPEYPEGEPENYVLLRPHSPNAADQMGDLWEVILPEDANVQAVRVGRGVWDFKLDPASWREEHLFRATGKRHVIANEDAKSWLEERAGEWLDLQETKLIPQIKSNLRRGVCERLHVEQMPEIKNRWPDGRKPCARLKESRSFRTSSF
jgi:hypothetical protein